MDKLLLSACMGVIGSLCGSVMFADMVTRLIAHKDVRAYGDGNPGSFNVRLAAGMPLCILCVLLDIGKGFLPALIAYRALGLSGWYLCLPIVGPVLGHAFPPMLHFHGGKAICTMFGVWIGLLPDVWISAAWAIAFLVLLPFYGKDHRILVLRTLTVLLPAGFILLGLTGQLSLVLPLCITVSLIFYRHRTPVLAD